MSDNAVIKTEDLGKYFEIYDKPHHRLLQMIWCGHRQYFKKFQSLQHISLEVNRGETVGILGRNGSGKSTLLGLICGTLSPTEGRVTTRGRIAALLELDSGFNPEFSGRENVYMRGSILGFTKGEIDRRFLAIAEFADIGTFMDQPLKIYSSGMVLRLAFAVSVHVDAEILIIDESLSVGDEKFQRKCFARIEEIKASGATILFVSHSGELVVQFCDRAILLDSGKQLISGPPKQVYSLYQRLLYAPHQQRQEIREDIILQNHTPPLTPVTADKTVVCKGIKIAFYDPELLSKTPVEYASQGAKIHSPMIVNQAGEQVNHLLQGNIYFYSYMVDFEKDASNIHFGMLIKNTEGVALGGASTWKNEKNKIPFVVQGSQYRVGFTFRCSLNRGRFFLNAGVGGDIGGGEIIQLHRVFDILQFRVMRQSPTATEGIVDFDCHTRVVDVTSEKYS